MDNNKLIVKNGFINKFCSFIKSRSPVDRNRFSLYKEINYEMYRGVKERDPNKMNVKESNNTFRVNASTTDGDWSLGQILYFEPGDNVDIYFVVEESGNASRVLCRIGCFRDGSPEQIKEYRVYSYGAGGVGMIEDQFQVPYDCDDGEIWVTFICEGGKHPCGALVRDVRLVSEGDDTDYPVHVDDIPSKIIEGFRTGTKLTANKSLFEYTIWASNIRQNSIKNQVLENIYVSNYVNDYTYEHLRTDIAGFIGVENFKCAPFVGPMITNMSGIFAEYNQMQGSAVCGELVTDMSNAYLNCYSLDGQAYIGGNVKNAYSTYSGCSNLTGIPVVESNNITNFARCFNGCSNINAFPVINSPIVGDATYMFNGCTNAAGNADMDVLGVTNADYMFADCSSLTRTNLIFDAAETMNHAFENCTNLLTFPGFGFNTTTAINGFSNCSNMNGSIDIPETVTNLAGAFDGCEKLSGNMTLHGNDVRTLNNFYLAFNNTNICGSMILDSPGTAVINFVGAFANCRRVGGFVIPVTCWSQGAASMKGMFNRLGHPAEEYERVNIVVMNATRALINTFRTVITDVTLPAATNVANINVNIPLVMNNGYVYDNIVCDCWGQTFNAAYNIYFYIGRPRPKVSLMMAAPPPTGEEE